MFHCTIAPLPRVRGAYNRHGGGLAVELDEPERPALLAATRGHLSIGTRSLPWEAGNALAAAVRRRRLTPTGAEEGWVPYQKTPIRLLETAIGRAISLANRRGAYGYDAYMLELAHSYGLPLLMLDARLAAVARRVGIALVEAA